MFQRERVMNLKEDLVCMGLKVYTSVVDSNWLKYFVISSAVASIGEKHSRVASMAM